MGWTTAVFDLHHLPQMTDSRVGELSLFHKNKSIKQVEFTPPYSSIQLNSLFFKLTAQNEILKLVLGRRAKGLCLIAEKADSVSDANRKQRSVISAVGSSILF